MPVYAIGDVQGCHEPLRRLLDQIAFDPTRDRLWFVGDLVNRGPNSLETLRFVAGLGEIAVCVLGNHDLHLLAMAAGNPRDKNNTDLAPILAAPDRDELLHWLRHRPLLHRDRSLGFSMLHAGLPPQWKLKHAERHAAELQAVLRSDDHVEFLLHMYGNEPSLWHKGLTGMDRLRYITNAFTRLRYCDAAGRMALKEKGPIGSQAAGLMPWFDHPQRASRKHRLVFGHWSTLGLYQSNNVWATDTGCLWGGRLTALRLDCDPPRAHQLDCAAAQDPHAFIKD